MVRKYAQDKPTPMKTNENNIIWYSLESLSLFIPVFFSSFGILSISLLLLNVLNSYIVLFVALIPSLIFSLYIARKYPHSMTGSLLERRSVTLLVIGFVIFWGVFNTFYASENVYINKDPGIYSSSARWLVDNDSLTIYGSDILGDKEEFESSSAGIWNLNGGSQLFVQAPHYFPVILGLMGRVLGTEAIFYINSFIGAMALLVVYGAARFYLRPKFALIVPLLLGLSLPMIYFTRDTYTEPLTMLLIFGAIVAIQTALSNDGKHRRLLWFVAGVVSSAATLVRVDSYLVVVALVFAVALLVFLKYKQSSLQTYIAYLMGNTLTIAVGFIDLNVLSTFYYQSLQKQINGQLLLLLFVVIVSLIAIKFVDRKRIRKALTTKRITPRLWQTLVIVIGAIIFLYVVTRIYWLNPYTTDYNNYYVASLQQKEGLPVDGSLSYAEISHLWIVWYFGVAVFILGYIGTILAASKLAFKKDKSIVIVLLLFAAMCALYINFPNITPDQIWATRRFLPVIFPALCLFAVYFIQQAYDKFHQSGYSRLITVALVLIMLIGVVIPTRPFITHKEYDGLFSEVATMCREFADNKVVLAVGSNAPAMVFPIRAHCNVPVQRIKSPSKETLVNAKKAAEANGHELIVVLKGHDYDYLPKNSKVKTMSTIYYDDIERRIIGPPTQVEEYKSVIFTSKVNDKGELVAY